MKRLLTLAALAEATTGLALLVAPALVVRLLFGAELTGVAIPIARVAGIALVSLGLACWPGRESPRAASSAMLTYSLLVALYLLYLGACGEWRGPLLWPAIVVHAVLAALLSRVWFRAFPSFLPFFRSERKP